MKNIWEECIGIFEIEIVLFCELCDFLGMFIIFVFCVWKKFRNFDFDNVIYVFLVLFEVFFLEGWLEVWDVI